MYILRQQKTASTTGLFLSFLLFLFLLVSSSLTIHAETATLDRTSFCMWGGGGKLEQLDLFDKPQEELVDKPAGKNILYGVLPYGNADDPVSFAYKERFRESPLIWMDSNNNEDLSDDGDPYPDISPSGWRTFTYKRRVKAKYTNSGDSHYVTVPVLINAIPAEGEAGWWDLVPSVSGTRRGTIRLEGEEYKIALSDLNWDGHFTPDETTVFIDSDGNGEICPSCGHEAYSPERTIWVADKAYEVASVSPSGRKIKLVPGDKDPSSRPFVLNPGHKLRDFRINTFDNKSFPLSSLRGEVVVLNFVPTLPPLEIKNPRKRPYKERLKNRIDFVEEFFSDEKYEDVKFLLVTVNSDYRPTRKEAEEFNRWEIGWTPQLAKMQPIGSSGLVILDKKGIIRYTDGRAVKWDSLGCKSTESRPATGFQIRWAVDRLLQIRN